MNDRQRAEVLEALADGEAAAAKSLGFGSDRAVMLRREAAELRDRHAERVAERYDRMTAYRAFRDGAA